MTTYNNRIAYHLAQAINGETLGHHEIAAINRTEWEDYVWAKEEYCNDLQERGELAEVCGPLEE